MPLTDTAIKNAKAHAKVAKLSDGGGLQLWIMPNGAKLWRMAYRFDGKQKKLAIGPYPGVGLKAARAAREAAKEHLRSSRDPSEQKRLEKVAKQESRAATFASLAAELREKKAREGKADGTLEKFDWLLGFANDDLGKRPIGEISAAEILAVLRKVEKRGRLETAKRLRSVIGQVFRYAIAAGKVANDPTLALRGALAAPKPTSRAAITDAKALGGLLRAIDAYEGQPGTRAALQLMALLFQRPAAPTSESIRVCGGTISRPGRTEKPMLLNARQIGTFGRRQDPGVQIGLVWLAPRSAVRPSRLTSQRYVAGLVG